MYCKQPNNETNDDMMSLGKKSKAEWGCVFHKGVYVLFKYVPSNFVYCRGGV